MVGQWREGKVIKITQLNGKLLQEIIIMQDEKSSTLTKTESNHLNKISEFSPEIYPKKTTNFIELANLYLNSPDQLKNKPSIFKIR